MQYILCFYLSLVFAGLGIVSGEGAIMQTDPKAFANFVIQLLQSASLRKKVVEKGVNIIGSSFYWDVVALTLENYLKDVAKKNVP